ncbi:aminoglycoside 3'-phosphotransferase/choline kinase family protein [Streptomyces sp. P38-E01]|uniref:Aminoglycoside 3'-phosphotransferase/choline kinase family protein n=1 Tax=Streptomyces tardus TaxID=2780544 RepID=A0A949JM90_9ACTN|nr:aminoglycoside 3'-phosphotransferase/choline kinase family protein [Streptomyces tardus]MBU7596740.1 aminoglycoside 3'-phosphotransferase/choline kinase family protein [Streptomyces tardus]
MTDLPTAATVEQYEAVGAEELHAAVAHLCERLGLPTERIARFPQGSFPVYALGRHLVLKLYPEVHADELAVESAALRALHGRLPLLTPGVLDTGYSGGWGYLLMERLYGESLEDAWPHIPEQGRLDLLDQLGRTLVALHRVPPPAELGPDDWQLFLKQQRSACVDRQRALGVGEEWLSRIPEFLDSVALPEPARPALLHTEFMPAHVRVEETVEGWTATGLLDFEPAMRGAPEYDLVAVGIFLTRGRPVLLRRLLTAYGWPDDELAELPRVLMAYTLLHAQCHLPWFMRELPPGGARSFEELAEVWFGV